MVSRSKEPELGREIPIHRLWILEAKRQQTKLHAAWHQESRQLHQVLPAIVAIEREIG